VKQRMHLEVIVLPCSQITDRPGNDILQNSQRYYWYWPVHSCSLVISILQLQRSPA